jgi:hypothetical protein
MSDLSGRTTVADTRAQRPRPRSPDFGSRGTEGAAIAELMRDLRSRGSDDDALQSCVELRRIGSPSQECRRARSRESPHTPAVSPPRIA